MSKRKKKDALPLWARIVAGMLALAITLLINAHFILQETEMPVQASIHLAGNGSATITEPASQVVDIPIKVIDLATNPSQVRINTDTNWGLVVFLNVCLIIGLWLIFWKVKW